MNSAICPGRFAGTTAIVTGAGSGIGRATAVRLAREGARVLACDIRGDRLEDLVAEFSDLGFVAVAGDVSAEVTVQKIAAAAGPRIDVLVNNAGIMDGFLPVGEVDDATWDQVFAVNVTAAMRLTRAVLPRMLEAGVGSIVNVGSEAGVRGSSAGAAYTASKYALNGLTVNTSVMYAAAGIRCNAVLPGGTSTQIEAPFKSALAGEVLGPIMQAVLPPMATPDQLAAAITWLASADSLNVTGALLASDGGWSAI